MSVEQVGPGSVSNSYGVRTTKSKLVYDNTDSYQDVFIPTGSVPVTAIPSATGLERLGERGATLLSPSIQIQSGLVGRRWAFLGESHTDGTGAGNFAYSYMYEALTMVGGAFGSGIAPVAVG